MAGVRITQKAGWWFFQTIEHQSVRDNVATAPCDLVGRNARITIFTLAGIRRFFGLTGASDQIRNVLKKYLLRRTRNVRLAATAPP